MERGEQQKRRSDEAEADDENGPFVLTLAELLRAVLNPPQPPTD